MLYKVVLCSNHSVLETLFTNYDKRLNYPPTQLREIGEEEAVAKLNIDVPIYIDHRVICKNLELIKFDNGPMDVLRCSIYYFKNRTCLILTSDPKSDKSRWFLGGCEHSYEYLSREECAKRKIPHYGNCYHVSQCIKCKYISAQDSSD
jgi:hypothetical protein